MATFLEQSKNCIYQADCREVLKQIPSETVDLIIADPPYYRMKGAFDFVFQDIKNICSGVKAGCGSVIGF